MKKVILGIVAVMACGITYTNIQSESALILMNELALQNVEALSNSEGIAYHCWEDGTVPCPDGGTAKYVFTGYSLK